MIYSRGLQLQEDEYFQQPRFDIEDLIPINSRNILEVGCGFGCLGQGLKTKRDCEIDGIEINRAAESHLRGTYRKFWIGDIEELDLSEFPKNYDCIIFPDVLEHLRDPWSLLMHFTDHLIPEGVIIASVPNIRNIGILYRLIVQGRWSYESSGVLDIGHLRFFTREEINRLFFQCGLEIEVIEVNRDNYSGFKGVVSRVARLFISDIDVCQFRIKARKL
ncbi:class I SAM-dependent methyltransferase [Methylomonas montana]|uniref:class I SAM-dependent methyltransferase n=1 Tax=Methylomonas montana TaxID=3058963 RepID=UPI002658796B|nr:class I SAM-dependent methyltransferase [Methylomonas montana]WKJ92032.1 class I SAM-dependent methyltransferase [Methylomonas montana]